MRLSGLSLFGLLALLMGAAVTNAAVLTYDFSGTLESPVNESAIVTGRFTIDTVAGTLPDFQFTGGTLSVDPIGFSGSVISHTPALDPNTDFVSLLFEGGAITFILLNFQSSLAAFDPTAFYIGEVNTDLGLTASAFGCFIPECDSNAFALFTDGTVTLVPTAVPEPASMALVALGIAALAFRKRT